jgi:hypothetical protein
MSAFRISVVPRARTRTGTGSDVIVCPVAITAIQATLTFHSDRSSSPVTSATQVSPSRVRPGRSPAATTFSVAGRWRRSPGRCMPSPRSTPASVHSPAVNSDVLQQFGGKSRPVQTDQHPRLELPWDRRDRGDPRAVMLSAAALDVALPVRGSISRMTSNGYVDDAVVHCRSVRQARHVVEEISERMVEVGLRLHPGRTRIVYCNDSNRRGYGGA